MIVLVFGKIIKERSFISEIISRGSDCYGSWKCWAVIVVWFKE